MDARKKNSWVNDDEQCNAHIVHMQPRFDDFIVHVYISCMPIVS